MIRLFSVCLFLLFTCTALAGERIQLFNGKDLTGWIAEGAKEYKDSTGALKQVWQVRDGQIFCDGKGFGFLRYAEREFTDFTMHVEFRMNPNCNSGLGIRTIPFDPKKSTASRPSYACYEIQLIDDAGKAPSTHSSGSLYRYVAPKKNATKPAGEWNEIEITCTGPRIRIKMNGEEIIDVDQSNIEKIRDKPRKGFVCLQNHGGKIDFKNVWIEEIKSAASSPR